MLFPRTSGYDHDLAVALNRSFTSAAERESRSPTISLIREYQVGVSVIRTLDKIIAERYVPDSDDIDTLTAFFIMEPNVEATGGGCMERSSGRKCSPCRERLFCDDQGLRR